MKKLVVALGAAVIVAGGAVTFLWLELRAGREQSREQLARVTALESAQREQIVATPEVEPVESSPAVAQPVPAAPPPVARTGATTPPAQPEARQPESSGTSPLMAGLMESMNTPEGREMTRGMMRGMMEMMYPDLARELDLTADEARQLLDLVVRQQETIGVESMSLMAGGDLAARQAAQRRMLEMERAQEAELRAMLGGKYPQWEEYQSTAAARQEVNQLRATLGASGNPLSEAQATQLIAAFAAEQRRTAQEERNWATSPVALNSPDMMQESMQRALAGQRRQVDVAAPHLDSAQLEQYRRQVEQQAAMLGAMMGMMGAQGSTP